MSREILSIEDIVARTPELPTIPAAALKVIQETNSTSSSAGTVASILGTDQALSVRVLRLSNSAYYGLSRRVTNLSEAVIVLGMRTVRNLALVASSYPFMVKEVPGYKLGPKDLWKHGFGVAVGAQLIAKLSKKVNDEEAFTAGLLCDIGKIALSIWFEDKTEAMAQFAVAKEMSFTQAEHLLLGYTHAEVGAHMALTWNLPESIVKSIRYHHYPGAAETQEPIVDCVHVADYLTMMLGFGLGGDGMQYEFDPTTLERLGLDANDLDGIVNDFVARYEEYESLVEELQAA